MSHKTVISIFLSGCLILFGFSTITAQVSEVVSDGTLRRIRVPILMYHYVSELPSDADDIRIGLTVEPDIFRSHLVYLRDAGYNTISLDDLHHALLTGTTLQENSIILTFDDGYIDHYETVYPLLLEYNFTATFFIITGRADSNNPYHLSWAQITEMSANGMRMEAHTKDHLSLENRDYDFLVYQILGSIESLEAHTGQDTDIFSYPAGRYDDTTLQIVESLGIWRAVTTQPGALHTTDNQYELPRLRITANMGVLGLQQLINSNR